MKTKITLYILLALLAFGGFLGIWEKSSPHNEINLLAAAYAQDPNSIKQIIEPNEPVEPNQPRKIVMPKGTRMPPKFKCPRHGPIGKSLLILEYEGVKVTYCKKCAMKFMIDVFDLNLPKLEIVK